MEEIAPESEREGKEEKAAVSTFDSYIRFPLPNVYKLVLPTSRHLILVVSISHNSAMSAQTLQGPLTAFRPPSSCFEQLWYNSISDKVLGNPYDTSCKPSGWNTAVRYSPAFCPLSYTSASGTVYTAGTVTETVVDCCPRYATRWKEATFTIAPPHDVPNLPVRPTAKLEDD